MQYMGPAYSQGSWWWDEVRGARWGRFGHSSPGKAIGWWSGENCNCFQFRDRSGVRLRTLDIYLMYTQATIRMVQVQTTL